MIKGLIAISTCLTLISCGMNDGINGTPGPMGPQGPAGKPGQDGAPAVIETTTCKLNWMFDDAGDRGHELAYTVMRFSNGAIGASLERTYYATSGYRSTMNSTILRDESDAAAKTAKISDYVVTAELVEPLRAKFTRVAPLEEKEVNCESK